LYNNCLYCKNYKTYLGYDVISFLGSDRGEPSSGARSRGCFADKLGLRALCSDNKNKMAANRGDVILVTGGAGFLGKHIVRLLHERADDVREIRVFDSRPFVNDIGKPHCEENRALVFSCIYNNTQILHSE
jgi:hypothetical protein